MHLEVVVLIVGLVGFLALRRRAVRLAHQLVEGGAALVDVRTRGEFQCGHLGGAINIPLDELDQRCGEIGPQSRPVVVYCLSGARSLGAKLLLRRLGFVQVVNLGRMSAW